MTEFPQLQKALETYLAAVEKRPAADGQVPELLPAATALEQTAQASLPQAPPQLRHYLANRSFRKAYLYLQGQDHLNRAGNCGRPHGQH
ncbi:MAG: hypothetical protein AAGK14_03295 [Verrucomicrobiota bacterium]